MVYWYKREENAKVSSLLIYNNLYKNCLYLYIIKHLIKHLLNMKQTYKSNKSAPLKKKMIIRGIKDFIKEETSCWSTAEVIWLITGILIITFLTILKSINDDECWYTTEKLISLTAAITGCTAAILTGQAKLGAFIFGLINSVLYAYISYKYKYYGEVMVKVLVFMPLNIYGMTCWLRNISNTNMEVIKRSLNFKNKITVVGSVITGTIVLGLILTYIGGKRPFIDASTTVLATTGLILTIKRYIQNWILWILLNIISIWLWVIPFYKGEGQPVAILLMWLFYLANSLIMYVRWKRQYEQKDEMTEENMNQLIK